MPDDINPITPPTITPIEPSAAPVAEPAVDEAQSVLDSVVTEVVPDEKPVQDNKTVETVPTITEHPISDEQAKQFAGMGDFSLPQSPLDNLDSVFGKAEPEKKEDEAEEKPIEGQPITPMVVSEIKPEVVTQEEIKSEAVKPDLTPPPPAVPSATLAPEDLEKKAAGMLKELDTVGGSSKPKKKKSGSMVKMALAAVLVVLMGAGGLVGMNLLKMQQVADQRSQATTVVPDECKDDVECYPGDTICKGEGVSKTGFKCNCAMVDCMSGGVRKGEYGVWNCEEWNPAECNNGGDEPPEPPAGHYGCYENGVLKPGGSYDGVSVGGNCLNSGGAVSMSRYVCPGDYSGYGSCLDNGETFNTTSICADVPSTAGWCGLIQVDYNFSNNNKTGCFVTRWIPCTSTPTPTPTPPDEPLVYSCTGLTKNVPAPAMGSAVVFTCTKGGTDTVNHYEFRYRIGTGANASLPAGTGNKSSALTIAALGDYTVECRVCKSTDGADCTVWGAAGK